MNILENMRGKRAQALNGFLLAAFLMMSTLRSNGPEVSEPMSTRNKVLIGSAGLSVAVLLLYYNNKGFRELVQSRSSQLKNTFLRSVVVPVYGHYDRIREKGFSTKDHILIGLAGLSCYGLKQVGDHYALWTGMREADFTQLRSRVRSDFEYLKDHKKLVLGMALVSGLIVVLIKEGRNIPLIEKFWRTLTNRQKAVMSEHPELSGHTEETVDPRLLKDHEPFTSMLQNEQKELLDQAVEEYRMKHDPLSLFDEFIVD